MRRKIIWMVGCLAALALLTAGCSQKGGEGGSGALPPVQSNAGQSSTANDPDALAERCADFRVIYVLSDEEQPGYEKRFISTALIQKHTSLDEATFFLCGPKAMYDFLGKELAPLNLPVKAVHRDATCCPKTPASSSAPCTCRTRSTSSPPRQTRPC